MFVHIVCAVKTLWKKRVTIRQNQYEWWKGWPPTSEVLSKYLLNICWSLLISEKKTFIFEREIEIKVGVVPKAWLNLNSLLQNTKARLQTIKILWKWVVKWTIWIRVGWTVYLNFLNVIVSSLVEAFTSEFGMYVFIILNEFLAKARTFLIISRVMFWFHQISIDFLFYILLISTLLLLSHIFCLLCVCFTILC